MRVVAILATYNEERFIGGCLDHLIEQGVEAYLIDNCSTDGTVEIANEYLGNGLIGMETLPRSDGFDRLKVRLQRKDELATSLDADWFMHMDPDEIRLPPRSDQTLAEAFEEVDAMGYNAVNFVEFTFIPTYESPEHDHPDFQRTMKWYYPFMLRFPHHIKAWKKQTEKIELAQSGGHLPKIPNLLLYPEPFKMRHYQFLSLEQAREKYLENKKLDRSDVPKGKWRGWMAEERIGMNLPSEAELNTYTSDEELSFSNPRKRHVIEAWALPEADRKEENFHPSSKAGASPQKLVDTGDELNRSTGTQPSQGRSLHSEKLVASINEVHQELRLPQQTENRLGRMVGELDQELIRTLERKNHYRSLAARLEKRNARLLSHYSSRRYRVADAVVETFRRVPGLKNLFYN